jgi:hypothetical protein
VKNKTFWKAFGVMMLLSLVGLLIITGPSNPDCGQSSGYNSCERGERLKTVAPAVIFVAVPMSIFVGVIAAGMQPTDDEIKQEKKSGKK